MTKELGELKLELNNLKQEIHILRKKFNKCWLCGTSDKLTEHHLQMRGKRKDGLGTIPLCQECHYDVEDMRKGYKIFFRDFYRDEYEKKMKQLKKNFLKIMREAKYPIAGSKERIRELGTGNKDE